MERCPPLVKTRGELPGCQGDASYLLYAAGATPTPDLAGPVRAHLQPDGKVTP